MNKNNVVIQNEMQEIENLTINKIAIFGSKSEIINQLSQKIVKNLQKTYKIDFLKNCNNTKDKDQLYFSQLDFLLLNGNYFNANQQILILDNENEDLLLKNMSLLNNVQFVITRNENAKFPNFLIERYSSISNLICYNYLDINSICNHIYNLIEENIASVNGLVLIGGKSTRMGTDKSMLNYHGKPQREFLVDLLHHFIPKNNIFYSVRNSEQINSTQIITDKLLDLGPFGGIYSAFMEYPNSAWLVVATDLPFINDKLIKLLISKRDSSKIATTFIGKNNTFPEPLITIWEPKAYPILRLYLSKGKLSLTKILKMNDVNLITIDDALIQNVNTKEAFEQIKKKL